MKKVISILACALLFFNILGTSYADRVEDMKERQNTLDSKKENYEEKLDISEALLQRANEEVSNIDSQVREVSTELKTVEEDISESKVKISESNRQLEKIGSQLDEKNKVLGDRVTAMYKDSEISYIEVILGSRNIIELFDRLNMVKNIVSHDKDILDQIKEKKDEANKLVESLEEEEDLYKKKARELEKKKINLDNLSKSKQAILDGIQETQAEYKTKVEELEKESKQIDNSIDNIRKEKYRADQYTDQDQGQDQSQSQSQSQDQSSSHSTSEYKVTSVGNQNGNPNILSPFNWDESIQEYNSEDYYKGRVPKIDFSHKSKRGPIKVKATAYNPTPDQNGGYGGITATGTALRPGIIAVDPSVIALGTRVYIEYSDGTSLGYFVAEDTGGAIKDNKIDILFMSRAQAIQFGVRDMKLYVLE